MGGKRRRRVRLTPLGWILTAVLVVLVVLAIVLPSPGVIAGLALALMIWALLVGSSFPTNQARGAPRSAVGQEDYGREAAAEYERKYGHPF